MTFNKYSDSKIYKLFSLDPSCPFVYYGSTTMSLHARFNMHKASFKHWLKDESLAQIAIYPYFKIHGIDKFNIELISKVDCKSLAELRTLERFHTDNNECINKNSPIRTLNEMKEIKRKNSAEYYKNNRLKHIEDVKKRYHERKKLLRLNCTGVDKTTE